METLSNMRVLITGSNGFTAKHMIPFLVKKGVNVAGFSRSGNSTSCHTYLGDLLDKLSLVNAINDFKPNVILHLAGIALPGFKDIESMYKINMFGTKNLLDAAVESGLSFTKFIVASSAHVYGIVSSDPVAESHATIPTSHYGNSKLGMENIARLYMDKLPVIITRPFNYTGVGQSTDYVLAKIISHYVQKSSEITLGNIDVVRDFSYIEDILNYYWALLNTDKHGFAVNLCSGVGTSLRDILISMDEIAGYKMKVNSNTALLRRQDNLVFIGDNRKLQGFTKRVENCNIYQLLSKIYLV